MRGKPEKFADHYTQARLFWASQKAVTDKAESAMGRFTAALVRHRVFERETTRRACNPFRAR
jgi:catalase